MSDHLLLAAPLCSYAVFQALSWALPNTQAPLLTAVFVFTSMVSRLGPFQRAVISARRKFNRRAFLPVKVAGLSDTAAAELAEALALLQDYQSASRFTNDRRKRLFGLMLWRQQRLCDAAGYSSKLERIDKCVAANQKLFDALVAATRAAYPGLEPHKPAKLAQQTSLSNYRVVECLGHFLRDWGSLQEVQPMAQYVLDQLDAAIPADQALQTCVVVPGSGLGRLAHEIARHRPYGAVHAVEFSGLMHAGHRFMYLPVQGLDQHLVYPHVHTTSNFAETEAQFRQETLKVGLEQPQNLHLHIDDFRYFQVPDRDLYRNVVVVSAFFIDTAENIMDYFDQINQIAKPLPKTAVENGFWINYGPLKYGSAAQAELLGSEIAHIRHAIGWRDLEHGNTLETELVGYITDKQSMWQGFYGVEHWLCAHESNKAKIKTKP